ncbi:MAG: hypothetical protein WDZ62_01080 [Candidatus Pacearchaeota archaeon]
MIKTRRIAGIIAGISLFAGFFFLDRGVTGNVVLNGNLPPFDFLSLVGLLLVFCSAGIAFYLIQN